jgi:hypothetical protein
MPKLAAAQWVWAKDLHLKQKIAWKYVVTIPRAIFCFTC